MACLVQEHRRGTLRDLVHLQSRAMSNVTLAGDMEGSTKFGSVIQTRCKEAVLIVQCNKMYRTGLIAPDRGCGNTNIVSVDKLHVTHCVYVRERQTCMTEARKKDCQSKVALIIMFMTGACMHK